MKIFLILFILLFPAANFSQETKPLKISLIDQEVVKSSDAPRTNFRISFQAENISSQPIILYGKNDEDDGFKPQIELLRYDNKTGKWLYLRGEKPESLDNLSEDEKEEYILQPGQSIKFVRWFWYSCIETKRKIAVYLKSNVEESPLLVYSEMFTVKKDFLDCHDKKLDMK